MSDPGKSNRGGFWEWLFSKDDSQWTTEEHARFLEMTRQGDVQNLGYDPDRDEVRLTGLEDAFYTKPPTFTEQWERDTTGSQLPAQPPKDPEIER